MERCSPTIRSSSLSPPFGQYHLRSWPICSFLFHASIGLSIRHMCWLCFLDNVPMNIYAFLALIGDVENYTNLPVYSRFPTRWHHLKTQHRLKKGSGTFLLPVCPTNLFCCLNFCLFFPKISSFSPMSGHCPSHSVWTRREELVSSMDAVLLKGQWCAA